MRALWVTTKPSWPPTDGGRLLMQLTLEALSQRGAEIELVVPYDPTVDDGEALGTAMTGLVRLRAVARRKRGTIASVARSSVSGEPLSISMHRSTAVARTVARSLAESRFDVVHAEQLQAFPQCESARKAGVPVVLRCQNVESDLWRQYGGGHSRLSQIEGARLARFEGRAVRSAAAVIALTAADAARLTLLADAVDEGRHSIAVKTIAAPFPSELPAAESRLSGEPAIVLLGSGGWHVNNDGARWFLTNAWPTIHAGIPNAILHVFGVDSPERLLSGAGSYATKDNRIFWQPHLDDSRPAFAPGSVLVVPLRFASGIRMRILEAWARGVPVVATPAAVHGMQTTSGVEVLVGNTGEELMAAIRRLHSEPETYAALVQAGRRRLRRDHCPSDIAAALIEAYERTRLDAARS